jgi:maleylacetate reductase
MMIDGVYKAYGIERVLFGRPYAACLGEEITRLKATRVFALVSRSLAETTPLLQDVRERLGARLAGVRAGVPQHMPRDAVVAVAAEVRAAGADLLVCIGGGSVIDTGKMVLCCLAEGVDRPSQLDRLHQRVSADGTIVEAEMAEPGVRMIGVPTTLSGGEFSGRAGCTDPATGMKHIYAHPLLAPRTVILDPWLTRHTPRALWLSSGIRAVDHATEGLCSTRANPYADGLALNALRLLGEGLRACHRDPGDIDARMDCQIGVWSAMGVLQAGVPMGASHGIGHVLGGRLGVAHGHTSCVMLPSVLRFNAPVNEARQRRVGGALGAPGVAAADAVASLVRALGLPGRLRDVDVGRDDLAGVAEQAMHDRWIHTNPRRIDGPTQIMDILEAAY